MLNSISFWGSDFYFDFVFGGAFVFGFAFAVGVAISVSAFRGT